MIELKEAIQAILDLQNRRKRDDPERVLVVTCTMEEGKQFKRELSLYMDVEGISYKGENAFILHIESPVADEHGQNIKVDFFSEHSKPRAGDRWPDLVLIDYRCGCEFYEDTVKPLMEGVRKIIQRKFVRF